jgi:uncharacterized membrane protein YphA (DoxX/SURF4 family)
MNIALWIAQIMLMLVFLASGIFKLTRTNEELLDYEFMGWVEDFKSGLVKFIGGAEVLGGLGIVIPYALGVAPILTQLAAEGLFVTMIGASVTHYKRKEYRLFAVTVVLGLLALGVDAGRFLQYDSTLFPG